MKFKESDNEINGKHVFCIHCKHCKNPWLDTLFNTSDFAKCYHPRLFKESIISINLIDGKKEIMKGRCCSCNIERRFDVPGSDRFCGPEGKYFEAK